MNIECSQVILHDAPIFRLILGDNAKVTVVQSFSSMNRFAALHILCALLTDDIHWDPQSRNAIDATSFDSATLLIIRVLIDNLMAEKSRRFRARIGDQCLLQREFQLEFITQKPGQLDFDLLGLFPWATKSEEPSSSAEESHPRALTEPDM